MKTIFTAIASTIIIGSVFTVAGADSAIISAATTSTPYPVTHNIPFAANSPQAKEELKTEQEYAHRCRNAARPEIHQQQRGTKSAAINSKGVGAAGPKQMALQAKAGHLNIKEALT
ncbi:hypothetical protein [Acidithiobacillus sulfuriphilus]|uniref:DUF4148 domain-containing protein n=2 Tax=Acidithiobacillus sulfuriphilus TaxID=1867749 RepID=A0A3M8R577_9PROT|nr:hypothetical protein [Acidithiobacillus sulfuriphilus]RNF61680.1 hypothetical protein EC580_07875 [Acidithiobacillus sulfuriphilus]